MIFQINCPDRESGDFTLWTVSTEWLNTLGRLLAPYFPFRFTDMWVDHVETIAGRKLDTPIDMISQGDERHGTRGIWRLDYWYRLFNLLLSERVAEAHRIISAVHGSGSDQYRLVMANADEAVQHYEQWALGRIDDRKLKHI